MSIGVLLSSHGRPHTLRPQLAAIDAQTVKPDDLVIFHDHAPGVQFDTEATRGRKVTATNWTGGVWNRFAFCLWGFSTEFICVLDDDTIPGPQWLKNCLDCSLREPGLYGTNGVLFTHGHRQARKYFGFSNPLPDQVPVDIVGHAFFFPRVLLAKACSLPRPDVSTAGEDYHLAFAAQAMGWQTWCPPHHLPELSGSTRPDLGTDDKALYRTPGEEEKKQRVHEFYLAQGWKPLAMRNNAVLT